MEIHLDPHEMFKVLSVPTRVKIVDLLKSEGPLGVKDISQKMSITPAAVSQHLKILRQAGLVTSERKGYWVPYSVNEQALENYRQVFNQVCTCGCEGSCRLSERGTERLNLESLKDYAKDLKKELKTIQDRIKTLEAQVAGHRK
ncbi:MAG: metalloregulator ArsR/SmtB family transcription factor [Thermodesulfobacteriota bacterium]